MDNMTIYEHSRSVPQSALKEITGGRMNKMHSINPMWRIEQLTKMFGVCGFGWYTEIIDQWLECCSETKETQGFVKIALYIKLNDEWSKPIAGVGGASFVAKERNGLYCSDEVYKMAYTDALSVACKALGIGADVYMGYNDDKYNRETNNSNPPDRPAGQQANISRPRAGQYQVTEAQVKRFFAIMNAAGFAPKDAIAECNLAYNKPPEELGKEQYEEICNYWQNNHI